MTNREFLTAIAVDENAAVEMREYAQAQLDKMDAAETACPKLKLQTLRSVNKS